MKKLTQIDGLKLSNIAGYQGFFEISDVLWLKQNKAILETGDFKNIPWFENLMQITKNPVAENWLNIVDVAELQKAKAVKGIIANSLSKETPLLAEIHTEGIYPSRSASAEIQSFINHLIRHIKSQLSEQQIQTYAPNVIAIKVNQFTLSSLSLFAEFSKLQTGINQLFKLAKNEHLSGISMYYDSIKNAMFFPNPFVSITSLLNKTEMAKLGLHFPSIKDFL